MRGLYSIHDISNSNVNIWDGPGFVAFLLCTPIHRTYVDSLRRDWPTYDAVMGNSLWTVVSFVANQEPTEEETQENINKIRELGVDFADTPCLLFSESAENDNYFIFRLKAHQESQKVGEEFFQIVDACKKHAPADDGRIGSQQFQALKQELRVIQNAEAVSRVAGVIGSSLMKILLKMIPS